MEKEKPIIVTENNANYFSLKRFRIIFWPHCIFGGGAAIFFAYVETRLLFTHNLSLNESIQGFGLIIMIVALLFSMYHLSDDGLRPLKIYSDGIEVPEVALSWKVPEMRKNNTLPTNFLPYKQIKKIETWFNTKGDLNRQFVWTKKGWKNYKKEIVQIEMHPPLAKEVMRALKKIVGTEQLAEWLEKGGMKLLSESPECRESAFRARRELVGDDVIEKISESSSFKNQN